MILHVTTEQMWNANQSDEGYAPDTFVEEGFIHCCLPNQLEGVLHRYFAGKKNLIVLHIDPAKLTAGIKHERSTGDELFPHVYGRINREAVLHRELLQ